MTQLLLTVIAITLLRIAYHIGAVPYWFVMVCAGMLVLGWWLTLIDRRERRQERQRVLARIDALSPPVTGTKPRREVWAGRVMRGFDR